MIYEKLENENARLKELKERKRKEEAKIEANKRKEEKKARMKEKWPPIPLKKRS